MSQRSIQLLVTVDTEEDNWWPTRVDLTARNVEELPRLHEVLDAHDVRPTYLVTYRVARDPSAARTLAELHRKAGAEVGAHLHPWNTPPQDRTVADSVSLEKLSESTQRAMIRTLTAAIEEAIGIRPRSFRAGRWSLSPTLVKILAEQRYQVDSSVLTYTYWDDVPGSPAYFHATPHPYRLGTSGDLERPAADGCLVEVPATAGFNRRPWDLFSRVDRLMRSDWLRRLHLHGILHRTGLLRRITLTPEQFPACRMLELARVAIAQELPVLNLHLHSNSLLPGCNEYVRSPEDRDLLLQRIDEFLAGLGRLAPWNSSTLSRVAADILTEECSDGD